MSEHPQPSQKKRERLGHPPKGIKIIIFAPVRTLRVDLDNSVEWIIAEVLGAVGIAVIRNRKHASIIPATRMEIVSQVDE